ncbi:hypothetical protein DUI87_24424 [Hirundo rustica rustica]|uniref:CHCH domain-containing protein n=1 Tax=Hirundo rustica rustica TaxID=333673 RepID=A0A3M0JEX9_HIRRU|nr:hypothetical protein DUI87_24424 [Hirundo rustica rustica]
MGGSESSHGVRRVSFGLDEREQVRVLQGIRLTEDVVNRMKESSQSKRDKQRSPRASNGTAPSSLATEGKPRPTGIQPPKASDSAAEHELYRRYEQEQALVREELLRLAKREREAASEAKERNTINEERRRTVQLVQDSGIQAKCGRKEIGNKEGIGINVLDFLVNDVRQAHRLESWAVELQGREAELKRQELFYKEQLARIEKKLKIVNIHLICSRTVWELNPDKCGGEVALNAEIYKLTSEQYQEAATKAEERIKLAQFCFLVIEKCEMIFPCQDCGVVWGGRTGTYQKASQDIGSKILTNKDVNATLERTFKLQSAADLSLASESAMRRRNADPICANLQSEILKCYRENNRQVLNCSELAKEYQRCVSAAQKARKALWPFLLRCRVPVGSVDALGQWLLSTLEEFLTIETSEGEKKMKYLDITTRVREEQLECVTEERKFGTVSLPSEQPNLSEEIPDSIRTQYQMIVN